MTANKATASRRKQLKIDTLYQHMDTDTSDIALIDLANANTTHPPTPFDQLLAELVDKQRTEQQKQKTLHQLLDTHSTINTSVLMNHLSPDGDPLEVQTEATRMEEDYTSDMDISIDSEQEPRNIETTTQTDDEYHPTDLSSIEAVSQRSEQGKWEPHPNGYHFSSEHEPVPQMRSSATHEIRQNYHVQVPELTDNRALMTFMEHEPSYITATFVLCSNPLRVLEALSDDQLRKWLDTKRLNNNIQQIARSIETLTDTEHRSPLQQWVDQMQTEQSGRLRRALYCDADKWTAMKHILPHIFQGASAIPFLTRLFTSSQVYVLALEEILPTLARDILHSMYPTIPTQELHSKTLSDVYKLNEDFRKCIKSINKAGSWIGMEAYLKCIPKSDTAEWRY